MRLKEMDTSVLEWIAYFLDAGYSLSAALELLIKLTNERNLKELDCMLKNGVSVKQAFLNLNVDSLWKEYFSLYSETNTVSLAIRKSLYLLQQKKDFLIGMKKKIFYPLTLLFFSFIFALFISIYLIPQLFVLYASFNQSPNTLILIYFTILSKVPVIFIGVCILGFFLITTHFNYIKKGNFNYFQKLSKRKILQKYIKIYLSLKFALYYKETARLTSSTKQALYILQKDNLQKDLKMLIYTLNEKIKEGYSLTDSVKKSQYFNDYFCQLFEMAIQTNQIEKTMELYVYTMLKTLNKKINHVMRIIIPSIYIYSAGSVVSIYFLIIIPLMNLVNQF